jgi:predicted DNA-binding transcriptional regulator YafY
MIDGVLETSARLLKLLALLQSRADWTGAELAERLGVGLRTTRRDIDRLRELGYPVSATSGAAGGYRLGIGAALPPLVLDDEEAMAVVISLRTAAAGSTTGLEEAALRALAKIQQVLPARLRSRAAAFQASTLSLTDSLAGQAAASVDPDLLAEIASACRGLRRIRFGYRSGERESSRDVEPYRLVCTPRRWYLLAWDVDKQDWRTFRVDRIVSPLGPPGVRFTPRPLPQEGAAAFVSRAITSAPYRYQARILFHAPLAEIAPRTSPTTGRLEAVDENSCLFTAGSESLEELAIYVAVKGVEFEVLEPPELIPALREVADRLNRGAANSLTADKA